MIDTLSILAKYYKKDSDLYNLLINHSTDVMNKAVAIAERNPKLGANIVFIKEAAMLHDIGICLTYAPSIECYGVAPYLCHGHLGREILEDENLPKHALVCERHTGIGLTVADIERLLLPLPLRSMVPETIEEEIVCFSDCFYSKNQLGVERTPDEVRKELKRYIRTDAIDVFDGWCEKFL